MGCGETCPVIPGTRHIEWDLADPEGRSLEQVRAIRDEIRGKVDALVSGVAGGKPEQIQDAGE